MAPDIELINAAFDRLRADPMLLSYLGTPARIWDRAPEKPKPPMPYIALGPTDGTPESIDCIVSDEIAFQIDVYSQGDNLAYSSAECRTITDRVKRLLHDADIDLVENALVTLTVERWFVRRDPDGVTSHGIVQLLGTVETP